MINKSDIGGVILAGGRASRMQFRDKALQLLKGKPLLDYVISNAETQVAQLALSVNHNIERYQPFGLPIVNDHDRSYGGPLLGILSAMLWYINHPSSGISHLACFPADVPDFPNDVVTLLAQNLSQESASVAFILHEGQIEPLFSIWHLDLLKQVEVAVADGIVGPKLLFDSIPSIGVDCATKSPTAFYNINQAKDLDEVERLMSAI